MVCVCACVCVVCVCIAYKLTYCKIQMSLEQIPQNHLKVRICTLHHLPLRYQTVVSEGKEVCT